MSIHSKGQNPKTWKPSEEIFVSALELVLASLTLVNFSRAITFRINSSTEQIL